MYDLTYTFVDLLTRVIFTLKACDMENKGFEIDLSESLNRNAGFNNIKRGFFYLDMMLEKHFVQVQN